ncbi:MAG: hypothetical protein Q4F67_07040 [Propionibacteriaceae bacterium]|nr:hypothetical protein [Propionibacteriaceae bacterium]
MGLDRAEHILLTTFNPDLKSVERVVRLNDGRIGLWTPDGTSLEQRLPAAATVIVRICDRGGKVDLEQPLFEGRAEFVASGSVFDEIKALTVEKYGRKVVVANVVDRAKELFGGKTPEGAVVINIIG